MPKQRERCLRSKLSISINISLDFKYSPTTVLIVRDQPFIVAVQLKI
jgi:hypothetical protein